MQAKKGEANFNCVQAIDGIDRANFWQPLDRHYQSQLLFIYNNCLPLVDDSSRQALIGSLLKHLQFIGEQSTGYDYTLNLARSYSLLGLYLDRSFYQTAADYYKSLLVINPNILSAYQDYGRMLIWSGDYAQAEVVLRQGIAKSPIQLAGYQSGTHQFLATNYTYYLWQLVGDCAYNQGHFSEALKIYQEVEAKNLVSKDLYQSIADSYYQLKDYQQSEKYLLHALELAPHDLGVNLKLANLYLELNNLKRALVFTEATLQVAPNNQEASNLINKIKALQK
jgi:tetratricopeptide (TPR) repeat protein